MAGRGGEGGDTGQQAESPAHGLQLAGGSGPTGAGQPAGTVVPGKSWGHFSALGSTDDSVSLTPQPHRVPLMSLAHPAPLPSFSRRAPARGQSSARRPPGAEGLPPPPRPGSQTPHQLAAPSAVPPGRSMEITVPTTLNVLNGSDARLPCTFSSCYTVNHKQFSLNWTYQECSNCSEEMFLQFRMKIINLKLERLKDRVEFSGNPSKYDVSVTLRSVQLEDEGIYNCYIMNPPDRHRGHGRIHLQVLMEGEGGAGRSQPAAPGAPWGARALPRASAFLLPVPEVSSHDDLGHGHHSEKSHAAFLCWAPAGLRWRADLPGGAVSCRPQGLLREGGVVITDPILQMRKQAERGSGRYLRSHRI
uniref:Ig-like domain-containing protein n=1 Tax=Suricata suricatta TaxID=37032 RepID=A0A673VBS6_SURSU